MTSLKIAKSLSKICVTLIMATPLSARAEVWWRWSFAGEEGLFLTDGQPADVFATKTFTILDFHVTKSGIGNILGAYSSGEYYQNQPQQGFEWNGAAPNYFFRSDGLYTNGAAFAPLAPDPVDFYGFQPAPELSTFKDYQPNVNLTEGPLQLTPLVDTWSARPDATIGSKAKKLKGDGVYNANGANQKIKVHSKGRRPFKFYYAAHTDSMVPDTLLLRGTSKSKQFKPKYYRVDQGKRRNITSSIKRGYVLPDLLPTSEVKIHVIMKQKASGDSRKGKCDLVATSASNASKVDRVMAKLVPKR